MALRLCSTGSHRGRTDSWSAVFLKVLVCGDHVRRTFVEYKNSMSCSRTLFEPAVSQKPATIRTRSSILREFGSRRKNTSRLNSLPMAETRAVNRFNVSILRLYAFDSAVPATSMYVQDWAPSGRIRKSGRRIRLPAATSGQSSVSAVELGGRRMWMAVNSDCADGSLARIRDTNSFARTCDPQKCSRLVKTAGVLGDSKEIASTAEGFCAS